MITLAGKSAIMLNHISLHQILFIDIETVPEVYRYSDLTDRVQSLWEKKMRWQIEREGITIEESYEKAGILAEFGKVVCITAAFYFPEDDELRVKSFYGDNEKSILQEFSNLLADFFYDENKYLCAHNGKEFDFPFLARRYLIQQMDLPYCLDLAGKKPWEVSHLDTMNLWKFGDYKHYTSLDLLTHIFDIPSPKQAVDGSDVARLFYEEKDYIGIRDYCEEDVVAMAHLVFKWKKKPFVDLKNIIRVR